MGYIVIKPPGPTALQNISSFLEKAAMPLGKKILSSSFKKCTEASNFGQFFSVLLKNVTYAKKVVKSICELWRIKKNLRNMQSQGKSPCARHKIICIFLKDTNKELFPCLEVRCEIQINQFWNFTIESLTILFRIKNDDFTKCYFTFQVNLQIQDHFGFPNVFDFWLLSF